MIALAAGLGLVAGATFATLFGDAAVASAIAALGTMVNTVLSAWLLRRQSHARTEIGLAAASSAAAAQSAADAARVAKSIGSAIRHEDPIVVLPPTRPPSDPAAAS